MLSTWKVKIVNNENEIQEVRVKASCRNEAVSMFSDDYHIVSVVKANGKDLVSYTKEERSFWGNAETGKCVELRKRTDGKENKYACFRHNPLPVKGWFNSNYETMSSFLKANGFEKDDNYERVTTTKYDDGSEKIVVIREIPRYICDEEIVLEDMPVEEKHVEFPWLKSLEDTFNKMSTTKADQLVTLTEIEGFRAVKIRVGEHEVSCNYKYSDDLSAMTSVNTKTFLLLRGKEVNSDKIY